MLNGTCKSIRIEDCKTINVKCKGRVPRVSIYNTKGVDVSLSEEAKDKTQIVTSNSSDMKLSFPKADSTEIIIGPAASD